MHGAPKHGPGFAHFAYVNPAAPKGGTLHQAAIGTFDTLNPFTLKGKVAAGLGPGPSLIHDRLMERNWDEPFTLYPLIARAIQVPDDRSSITFHLDPRARFSDDTPLTADDVLFSFDTLKTNGRPNMRRVYALVSATKKIDAHTVQFQLGPGHDRETVMILASLPVLSRADWEKRDFNRAQLTPGVTSGPYVVKTVEPGRRVVLERNPKYWARDLPVRVGLHNFDTIIYDYYRDENVAFEAFKSGNLNFRRETDITNWMQAYDFPRLKNGEVVRAEIPHGRAEAARGFIFNTRRAPFDNVVVRRALARVFDADFVNKSFYGGALQPNGSFFPNTDLAACPVTPAQAGVPKNKNGCQLSLALQNETPRMRMMAADAALKSAGWVVKNGTRVHEKTGQALTFEILLGAPMDEKIALSYIQSLKKLGIRARTRTLDTAAFRDRLNTYDYDMVLYFWQGTLSPGGEQLLYWGCDAAKQEGRFNYAGICDPDIDRLAAAVAQTQTRDDLRAMTQDLDRRLQDLWFYIGIGINPADRVAYDRTLQRPATTPLYGVAPESWWAQD